MTRANTYAKFGCCDFEKNDVVLFVEGVVASGLLYLICGLNPYYECGPMACFVSNFRREDHL